MLNPLSEDEFDDFNAATQGSNEEEEFGDFGNDSHNDSEDDFDDFEAPQSNSTLDNNLLNDNDKLKQTIDSLLDEIIPATEEQKQHISSTEPFLDERSGEIFQQLSQIPHLRPNHWVKLHIRHNLLIKLGIPINLDEINDTQPKSIPTQTRRKSVNEPDINWDQYVIPKFEQLKISVDEKNELLAKTSEVLSRIETDVLNNTSKLYLEASSNEKLRERLVQFKQNYEELTKIASVWIYLFEDLKKNSEMYELVVQNLIGYSQKLERDELLNNLKNLKSKKKKRSVWR